MTHIHLGERSFPLWALVFWTLLEFVLIGTIVYRVRKGGIKTHQIALAGIGAAASFAIFQLNIPVWGGIHMNLTGLVGLNLGITVIEGLLTGFIVQFLATVRPDLVGLADDDTREERTGVTA